MSDNISRLEVEGAIKTGDYFTVVFSKGKWKNLANFKIHTINKHGYLPGKIPVFLLECTYANVDKELKKFTIPIEESDLDSIDRLYAKFCAYKDLIGGCINKSLLTYSEFHNFLNDMIDDYRSKDVQYQTEVLVIQKKGFMESNSLLKGRLYVIGNTKI
jgi:hypothetical protein